MKKIIHYFSYIIFPLIIGLIFLGVPLPSPFAEEESISLTTYYPAPYGVYDGMAVNRLGVGDNDGNGILGNGDVPTRNGDVWINGTMGIGVRNYGPTPIIIRKEQPYVRFEDTEGGNEWAIGVKGNLGDQRFQIREDVGGNLYTRLAIKEGGNIGIGDDSPLWELDVNGTIRASDELLVSNSEGALSITPYQNYSLIHAQSNNYGGGGGVGPAAIVLGNSGENVGIGNVTPGYELDVNGNIEATGVGTSLEAVIKSLAHNEVHEGAQDSNGWLVAAIVAVGVFALFSSSVRYKTDVKTIDNALEKVEKLRGVEFDWKSSGKHDIGLIAEEVAEVIPEVIIYEKDGKTIQGLHYQKLVGLLVEAIKEQANEIVDFKEKTQNEIDELKEKMEALEASLPTP